MDTVGLIPSATGSPGGKRTGQRMTHYIEAGGRFDLVCADLLKKGYVIDIKARTPNKEKAKKKAASKTKYTCPGCDFNAWAKPDADLWCGFCDMKLLYEAHDFVTYDTKGN